MIMRKAASCCQPLHEMVVPRGARTVRGPLPSGGFAEEVFSTLGMVYSSFPVERLSSYWTVNLHLKRRNVVAALAAARFPTVK